MDARDQLMMNLKQENQMLRKENEILKIELLKFSGTNYSGLNLIPNNNNNLNNQNGNYGNQNQLYLPPIQFNKNNVSNIDNNSKNQNNINLNRSPSNKKKNNIEYNMKTDKEKSESKNFINSLNYNQQNLNVSDNIINSSRGGNNNDVYDKQNLTLMQDNMKLKEKIANLENAFLSGNISQHSRSQFSKHDNLSDNEESDNSGVKIYLFNIIYQIFS